MLCDEWKSQWMNESTNKWMYAYSSPLAKQWSTMKVTVTKSKKSCSHISWASPVTSLHLSFITPEKGVIVPASQHCHKESIRWYLLSAWNSTRHRINVIEIWTNDACLVRRFLVLVERMNQQMLGHNIPTLHTFDVQLFPGAAADAETEHSRPWCGVLLQFSAQKKLFQDRWFRVTPPSPQLQLHREFALVFI